MTREELKKLLAPETFACQDCKKQYQTGWEAQHCWEKDAMHRRAEEERQKEEAEKNRKDADKLKKVLEDNL